MCPCPPDNVVKAPIVARHSVWCCTLGFSYCRQIQQRENREASVCVCVRLLNSIMDTGKTHSFIHRLAAAPAVITFVINVVHGLYVMSNGILAAKIYFLTC